MTCQTMNKMFTLDDTKKHFDSLKEYGKLKNKKYLQAAWNEIEKHVDLYNKKIVDLGCGDGKFLCHVSNKIKSGIGVDISSTLIENARKNCSAPNIKLYVNDAEEFKLANKSDIAVCIDVLEHTPNPSKLIKNACSSADTVVFITPNPSFSLIIDLLDWLKLKVAEGPHKFLKKDFIESCLREENFLILLSKNFFVFTQIVIAKRR